MPITLLKSLAQAKFLGEFGYSSEGICYYICEYVEEKIWAKPGVGAFKDAVKAAESVIPSTIIKAGKAKNLAQKGGGVHGTPQDNYPSLNTPLKINSLYRIGLWFGALNDKAPASATENNHEAIVITGAGSDIVFLEPNFGFYRGQGGAMFPTNKDVLEGEIKALYTAVNYFATNFTYSRVRGL
ncbi:hypothetical protein U737_21045 [Methylomonas sp. LW13]|uniref:hypothetical protein n=1 Tax=unclassified Methylomonas TaxID=2608980 RepID=UPI00051AB521|nr:MULTISPECIES: hypothetical protein [unclassified Methylomonas]PKD38946.1 hypothetical protein CWO84_18030 [Methylomonas sp. Kb3]QBC29197.1 hypothetical protein U737_21045 [Methylomonas sp. LW13]